MQRSLAEGHAAMAKRLARKAVVQIAERNAAHLARLAKNRFKRNQLMTANGPRVKIADLRSEHCSADLQGKVTCAESTLDASSEFQSNYDADIPR